VDALRVADEVIESLANRTPVVALESTVLTHGLPADRALTAADEIDAEIRACDAVPATIAVIDGVVTVGVDPDQRRRLVEHGARKAASRDLPFVVADSATASTTVGATCAIAQRVGIDVFATGGIGGVHRDAERSFDESADLADLARTGRIVVSAGIKSLLDVPATVERLESWGVPVLGYRTDDVPAFWMRSAGVPVPARVEEPSEVAAVATARALLGLQDRCVLVLQPVPAEAALDPEQHRTWVEEGLDRAAASGVTGAAVTPFVLDAVHRASGGATVTANISLLRANAALAARIAAALRV
jgi:pseudouridine-5'-phosphate glycosidase